MRWLKLLAAVFLFPTVIAGVLTLFHVLAQSVHATNFWIAFLSGAMTWLLIFGNLPKPMWLYVVGHELTHAVWALMFGSKVRGFRASARGGHVILSKSNTLIVLAPYFFPLYAVVWSIAWWIGDRIWDWQSAQFLFHFGLGITYLFHLTLTAHILRQRQPDIVGEGWFFAFVVILLIHLLGLFTVLPAMTETGMFTKTMFHWWKETLHLWHWLFLRCVEITRVR